MRLVIKSITGVDMPSPMAPTRPSTMSTTSAASACMNTDANDRITGAGFLALAAASGGPSSLPMSAGDVVAATPHSPRRVSLVTCYVNRDGLMGNNRVLYIRELTLDHGSCGQAT